MIYFQYLKPSALRYGSGPDGSLALAVPAAEILDQADADQSQGEQAGEHRNQRGVAMSLIGRVRDHERGQLVAGQAGERPGAQRETVRGGDGLGAEVLVEQHRQRRETAAVASVDEEQHGQHGPQQHC